MNSWIAGQVRRAVTVIRALHLKGEREVFLHFRRGSVVASPLPTLGGYERVTALSAPLGKSEADLNDWALHETRRVPCCP